MHVSSSEPGGRSVSRPPKVRRLAILGFHKIGDPPADGWETWFYLPEETFVGYLRYLKESHWRVIDLATFLGGLASPESLPERAALLTFDDGYRSLRDRAVPVLVRFGYPAVVFVPTDYIGGRNSFDADNEPDEAICDWSDLRDLERQGVSVQSHGASHRALSLLEQCEQREELRRSKSVLEAGLGRPVEVFCFPYGDGGADVEGMNRALMQTGYRAACLYGGGPNPIPIPDAYRLLRVAMGPDTDLEAHLGKAR